MTDGPSALIRQAAPLQPTAGLFRDRVSDASISNEKTNHPAQLP
ncbi:MAG: hypothetical protein OXC96_09620 [Cyanobacteria bacterium MAG CAR1_bin_15]|nr:hypothetical protein [Cyanobacteria bacterium MAG CAR1_bin_15]